MKKILLSLFLFCLSLTTAHAQSDRETFETAIYVMKNSVNALADTERAEREFARISDQLDFDKVYLEVYRSGDLVDEASLIKAIEFFETRGIKTATKSFWMIFSFSIPRQTPIFAQKASGAGRNIA